MKKFTCCVVFSLLWLVPYTMATPVQWSIADGGNGHYYEAILEPDGISWTDADIAASSKVGDWHLVTISSAEENAFVYDLVNDDPAFWKKGGTSGNWGGPWIGGYQVNDTGPWHWVTGEPFDYKNWGPLEPFGNGDKIALFGYQTTMGPYWNDAYDTHMYHGYIIESGSFSPPVPPDVEAGENRTCHKGVEVILMATFFDNPSDTHTAWWDFDGDGAFDQEGIVDEENGSGAVYGTHVYDLPGEYTAWVCVQDDKGESACDDIVITVIANQPPVAQCQDITLDAGPDCEVAASIDAGSSDPDGDPITIIQDPAGPYPVGQTVVTLIVTDDFGASDSCTATVTVMDTWPPEVICQDVTVTAGPGGVADADVDDGSYDTCGDLFSLVQIPAGPYSVGVTEVILTATDLSGNTASCLAVVTVLPQVVIDIKPTDCPNPLNVDSRGVLPMAIVGTDDFDISMVDPESVRLIGIAPLRWSFEDVCTLFGPLLDNESEFSCTDEGPDGLMDMALKFDNQEIAEALELISGPLTDGEEILVSLTGSLLPEFGGAPIEGKDVVRIIKKVK